MNKLRTFFVTLFRSATDPVYYNDIVKASSGFSFKYFTLFYAFLAIITTAYLYYTSLQSAPAYVDNLIQSTADMYPSDLEVTFDTNTAEISTAGVEEPIIIPLPESENVSTDLKNLLVIDTSATAEQISSYQTAVLLTKTHLATLSDSGSGFQIFALKELAEGFKNESEGFAITSFTLNKSLINSNLPMVKLTASKIISFLPYFLVPTMFIGYWISRFIYIAFMSVFILLLNQLLGRGLKYAKVFQIGLHTITITDAITKLSGLVFADSVASIYNFAFFGITFLALLGIKPVKKKLEATS